MSQPMPTNLPGYCPRCHRPRMQWLGCRKAGCPQKPRSIPPSIPEAEKLENQAAQKVFGEQMDKDIARIPPMPTNTLKRDEALEKELGIDLDIRDDYINIVTTKHRCIVMQIIGIRVAYLQFAVQPNTLQDRDSFFNYRRILAYAADLAAQLEREIIDPNEKIEMVKIDKGSFK